MSFLEHERQALLTYITEQKLAIKTSVGWKNLMRSTNAPQALVLDVSDLKSLIEVLRKINGLNMEKSPVDRILVRPAAGGRGTKYSESHSVHGVSGSDVIIRLMGQEFREIKQVDDNTQQVTVGGSIQIGELNEILNKQYKLALPNASLSPYITVAGLSANSGVGTGQDEPSFSGLVQAFTICLPDGRLVEVDRGNPCFEAIQSAHQGLFGFVVEVKLQCRHATKLERVEQLMSVADFCEKVHQGLFQREKYVSAMLQALYLPNESTDKTCRNVRVYIWRPVDDQTPERNAPTLFGKKVQEALTTIYDFTRTGELLARMPIIVPPYSRYLLAPMSIGIRDSASVTSWPSSVHHQTSFPHDIIDAAFLFPVSSNGQEIIQVLGIIYDKIAEYARRQEYPVLTGMYLRYLQGSNGGVSTTAHDADKHICSLDLVSSTSMSTCTEAFLNDIWVVLRERFNARPHLGKWLPKGYEIDSSHFRQALSDWYAQHHIPLEHNMLLTEHYCKLYHLPAEIRPAFSAIRDDEDYDDLGAVGPSSLCALL